MNDTLTGCLERRLVPPEYRNQSRTNYLYDLQEAQLAISAFLEDYNDLFREEINSFLTDIRFRVNDEMEDL